MVRLAGATAKLKSEMLAVAPAEVVKLDPSTVRDAVLPNGPAVVGVSVIVTVAVTVLAVVLVALLAFSVPTLQVTVGGVPVAEVQLPAVDVADVRLAEPESTSVKVMPVVKSPLLVIV